LLGDAFIHLIPETFTTNTTALSPSLLVLAGVLLFFVVEKLLPHRDEPLHQRLDVRQSNRPELVWLNVIGDATHNFIDGVLIGASYLANPTLGISTTIAVLLTRRSNECSSQHSGRRHGECLTRFQGNLWDSVFGIENGFWDYRTGDCIAVG
jgi:hypothetical protein